MQASGLILDPRAGHPLELLRIIVGGGRSGAALLPGDTETRYGKSDRGTIHNTGTTRSKVQPPP